MHNHFHIMFMSLLSLNKVGHSKGTFIKILPSILYMDVVTMSMSSLSSYHYQANSLYVYHTSRIFKSDRDFCQSQSIYATTF